MTIQQKIEQLLFPHAMLTEVDINARLNILGHTSKATGEILRKMLDSNLVNREKRSNGTRKVYYYSINPNLYESTADENGVPVPRAHKSLVKNVQEMLQDALLEKVVYFRHGGQQVSGYVKQVYRNGNVLIQLMGTNETAMASLNEIILGKYEPIIFNKS